MGANTSHDQYASRVGRMSASEVANEGNRLGAQGYKWRCRNCNRTRLVNEYYGNIKDGTAECPSCGKDPTVRPVIIFHALSI